MFRVYARNVPNSPLFQLSRYNARNALNGRLYEHVPHEIVFCSAHNLAKDKRKSREGGSMNTMLTMGVGVLTN